VTARFELRLADGRVVSWVGSDGPDAARRYVDGHPEALVVATRRPPVALLIGCQTED
jgi:hypothetical protein